MRKGFICILLLLAAGCGDRKEQQQDLAPGARKESLMQKSEEVLGTQSPQDTAATKSALPDETPKLPESLPQVNVTLWAGMTYEKLDQILGEFSLTDPPSIRYFGICDKIVFRFADNSTRAKLLGIDCLLDKSYPVREALQALGIAVVHVSAQRKGNSVESTFGNEKVASVRSYFESPKDTLTKKIVIAFK